MAIIGSILTNTSAQTALQTLTRTTQDLQTTQNRISTGLRVASAADNAAYFAIATSLRSDSLSLSAVTDSLNYGASTVGTALSGVEQATDIVSEIQNRLVSALTPGVGRQEIQDEITQFQNQLQTIASSASIAGQNFLSIDSSAVGFNATRSFVASFSRDSTGAAVVSTIDLDITATALIDPNGGTPAGILDTVDGGTGQSILSIDISALTDSAADLATLSSFVTQLDAAVTALTGAASTLGSVSSRITLQQSFVQSLQDSVDASVGALVDADLNRESTRLQALQVQQQLGVQSLSIANQSTQAILQLFR